ncbi:hypothetical protein EPD62_009920 [Acetivibrio thermocellus]
MLKQLTDPDFQRGSISYLRPPVPRILHMLI